MTNEAIHRDLCKGKHVLFHDRNEAYRIAKVVKIDGNTFTVKDAVGRKERVEHEKVLGVYKRNVIRNIFFPRVRT
jgi:hypothetical protein